MKNPIQKLEVRLHRSESEVEELRDFWTAGQNHPNADIDHFLLVCRLRSEVIAPCVLSVSSEGSYRCLVAARVAHSTFQPRIGYLRLPRFQGKVLSIIHQGVIGKMLEDEAKAIIQRVAKMLEDREIDFATFSSVPENSPLLPCIIAHHWPSIGLAARNMTEHWELTLPTQPGQLLQGMKSKHRTWIRKKTRDIEAAYPGKITWKWHRVIEDVAPICGVLERVAAHTYQRGLNAGFKDDAFHRERLALFAKKGALRVLILEVDRQPVAFWYGIVYQNRFHSEATGYLPRFREFEVGTQIFIALVDELVRESVKAFDFGLGDASYKQRFGDRSWRETSPSVFPGTFLGKTQRAYFGTCERLDHSLRAFFSRFGLIDRLKRSWRRGLIPGK